MQDAGALQDSHDWQSTLLSLCTEGPGWSTNSSQLHKARLPSEQVPASLLKQVQGSPVLLNLLTTLSSHRRTAETQVLPPAVAEQVQEAAQQLSDALRTVLCL